MITQSARQAQAHR